MFDTLSSPLAAAVEAGAEAAASAAQVARRCDVVLLSLPGPRQIESALTGEAGFTREQVGKITVTDQTTYVAVVRDIAREAVRKLSAGKVKGRTVKVRALAG